MHATRTFEIRQFAVIAWRICFAHMSKTFILATLYMRHDKNVSLHDLYNMLSYSWTQAIIYSFAVTLSIKLRLLLSAEGAMEQELVMCSEAMHEHEHQYMISKLSGSTPERMQATGGGRPKQSDICRSTNQLIFTMINTPTGRPKRFTYAIFMTFESKIL
jgi:hypothetical protein